MMAPSVLSALRERLAAAGLRGFLIPKADRHLGEYAPAADERLAFVSGFTGSAGLAIVLEDRAALFVDGRYELQAAEEAGPRGFEIVHLRETDVVDWLPAEAPAGAVIGFDPILHATKTIERYAAALEEAGASLSAVETNPVDAIWTDRPSRPTSPARDYAAELAGRTREEKRALLVEALAAKKLDAAVVTAPDSIAWALNIRGADLAFSPVTLAYAILRADGRVSVIAEPAKFDADLRAKLGDSVEILDWAALPNTLGALSSLRVGVDQTRSPAAIGLVLEAAGATVVDVEDLCLGPKAAKTAAELEGARAAHRRDGAALAAFFAWFEATAPSGALDELAVAKAITRHRRETGERLGAPLWGESFPPIVGFGPNGAIVHYRVTTKSSRPIAGDGLLLIDSGGQYEDATTDVTRVIAVGAPSATERAAFTLVLKGMIAMSELRFPAKCPGRRLDMIARLALWREGLDYDHGTGHGVGAFLNVHEGPASLSAAGAAPITAGMILSNEPGVYVAGRFGVRIENLLSVATAAPIEGGLGDRPMHRFETLTLAPIDRRLIELERLDAVERAWIDAYHARVLREIGPQATAAARDWLEAACAPL